MCGYINDLDEHHKVDKAQISVNSPDRVITLRVRETACQWYGKLRRVWRSPEKQRNLHEA